MVFAEDLWQDISTRTRILHPPRKIQVLPLPLIPDRDLHIPATSCSNKGNIRLVSDWCGSHITLQTLPSVPDGVSLATYAKWLLENDIFEIVVGSRKIFAALYQLIGVEALWLLSMTMGE